MNTDLLSIRIDKLERQLSFWRLLVALPLLMCAANMVTRVWAAPTRIDATTVVARAFELVNPSGRVTARLVSDPANPDSPNLAMKYPNDKAAVVIGTDSANGSSVVLCNKDGHPRAMMKESENGPAISLFDENDKLRIAAVARKGETQIAIWDKNTKRIWVVPTTAID